MTKFPRNIYSLSAKEIGKKLLNLEICPIDLMSFYLDKIESYHFTSPYIEVFKTQALKNAKLSKKRILNNRPLDLLDGIPIAWKDLFDISGYKTHGGSKLLINTKIAKNNSTVVQRTLAKGLIPIGKTRTVEFALGGLGTNKNYGTPENAVITDTPRVPGGSSSGSATALARNMCALAVGTDTGGSVRIPAAWNKLYGLKTSYGKVPTQGVLPLSKSLDTVGPITKSVEDLNLIYSIFSQEEDHQQLNIFNKKILVARGTPCSNLDKEIEIVFENVLSKISATGIKIDEVILSEMEDMYKMLSELGTLVTFEAWNQWKHLVSKNKEDVDPNVLNRMLAGSTVPKKNITKLKREQIILSTKLYSKLKGYDALIMPTVPILPPKIKEVEEKQKIYNKYNILALRNTSIGNNLPLCGITIPYKDSSLPIGIMFYRKLGEDYSLLKVVKKYDKIIN